MDERVLHFRVGVMVMATVMITLALIMAFGGFSWLFVKTRVIQVRFSEAPGLAVGTPVRKSGVRIGEVVGVEFTADDEVLATLRINAKYTLHHDEVCHLKTTLFGDTSLEFQRDSDGQGPPGRRDASPATKDTGHIDGS